MAVVAVVVLRVAQSEIGAEIDDEARLFGQRSDAVGGGAVGKRDEGSVDLFKAVVGREAQARVAQGRVRLPDRPTGLRVGGGLYDLDLAMAKDQPQQPPADVSRTTDDSDFHDAPLP